MRGKQVLLVCLLAAINSLIGHSQVLEEITGFGENPGDLFMYVRKNKSEHRPMVIVLHGCSQTAEAAVKTSGWDKLAEQNDLFLLAPQQKSSNNLKLCFNWFNTKDTDINSGEMASISAMINYCRQHFGIDSTQIYITGFSAGAAMAVSVMAVYPQLIQAGAIFAGGPYQLTSTPTEAYHAMRGHLSMSHEELIKTVKNQHPDYQGTYPNLYVYQGTKDIVVASRNADLLIDQWIGINKMDSIKGVTTRNFGGKDFITQTSYVDLSIDRKIILFQLQGIGHKLLVDPGEEQNKGGVVGYYAVDKDFWAAYQVALDFGLIKKN